MKIKDFIIIGFLFIIYLFFPSSNPTTDSWYYASCVKYGSDLFLPHHLLYNAFNYELFLCLDSIGFNLDALSFMQALNAFIAAFCLIVFRSALLSLDVDRKQTGGYILIAGSSFVFMRFATDNEAYLLPLLLSLFATYFFFSKKYRNFYGLVLSGFLAALACLFHQVHFFWWLSFVLAIGIYQRSFKSLILFTTPALLVPIVYYIVVVFGGNQSGLQALLNFVFYEYVQGVSTSFSPEYLLMGVINFFRSFIQLHGNIISFVKLNLIFIVPAILALTFLIFGLSRKLFFKRQLPINPEHVFLFSCAFGLQLIFAVYSFGNAEFMLMLPILLILTVASLSIVNQKTLYWLGTAMLVWNLFFAVVPNHRMQLNSETYLSSQIMMHPGDLFIVQNSQQVENRIYYKEGKLPENILRSPFSYNERGKSLDSLQNIISSALQRGQNVYSDCLNSVPLDRSFILSQEQNRTFFSKYRITKSDSIELIGNMYYLFKVCK